MKRHTHSAVILVLLFMGLQPLLGQNYMIKQKVHTDEAKMMGQTQPATDKVQTIWFSENAIAMVDEENTIINDLKNKKVLAINHADKTYTEMSMDPEAAKTGDDEEAAGMAAMMQGMAGSMTFLVEPTGKKKKIGQYDCDEYKLTMKMMMMPMEQMVYATTSLKMDKKLAQSYMTASFAMMPGMQSQIEKMTAEMEKIKGVTVRTESSMSVMGSTMKSWTELIEFKEASAPAGVFTLPKGYKKQAGDFKGF